MIIGGLQRTTLIDYPGKIAATIFLSGCNFLCPWCYSAELVLPERIEKHPKISEKEVFDFLKGKKGLIDGVVICGGEPTIQKDLKEFITKIKKMGFAVKLDTNGSNSEMLKDLIDSRLLDYVAMDIKTSKDKYSVVFKNESFLKEVEKSVEILKNGKISFEFRTTVVPAIQEQEDFLKIAKWIGGSNIKYYLQNFRPEKTIDKSFESKRRCSDEWMKEIKEKIESFFQVCEIR